jgi:hypothetical protein
MKNKFSSINLFIFFHPKIIFYYCIINYEIGYENFSVTSHTQYFLFISVIHQRQNC